MRIDAHQHFWRLARGDYGWLTPALEAIHRDFDPRDLAPLLAQEGIDGTVLVQAAPTEAETEFLLSLAGRNDFVLGVVGWTDFAATDAPDRIARLATRPGLVGLRPMIQDIEDDGWMLRADLSPAFEAMARHDLVFDALVLPRHLPNLRVLLGRHPRLRAVVDHCAKPPIADGTREDWARDIGAIAAETGAFCKLSGLVTEAGRDWTLETLRPWVNHALNVFGPSRLIWGSDWPVATLAATYGEWMRACEQLLAGCAERDRQAIFGGNAARLYKLHRAAA